MKKIDLKMKIDFKTAVLLFIIIFSMIGIFYLTIVLTTEGNKEAKNNTSIGQVKIKAESKTLNKPQLTPTSEISPTSEPTTEPSISPTSSEEESKMENQLNNEELITPTPTEIILAYNTSTDEGEISPTVKPTKITSIPETGNINSSIMIFSAALFFILFSLIY
jgi:cytoskeletal protein RodZ